MKITSAKNIASGTPSLMRPGKMRKMPSQALSLGASEQTRTNSKADAASLGATMAKRSGKSIGYDLSKGATWKKKGGGSTKSSFRKFNTRSQ